MCCMRSLWSLRRLFCRRCQSISPREYTWLQSRGLYRHPNFLQRLDCIWRTSYAWRLAAIVYVNSSLWKRQKVTTIHLSDHRIKLYLLYIRNRQMRMWKLEECFRIYRHKEHKASGRTLLGGEMQRLFIYSSSKLFSLTLNIQDSNLNSETFDLFHSFFKLICCFINVHIARLSVWLLVDLFLSVYYARLLLSLYYRYTSQY